MLSAPMLTTHAKDDPGWLAKTVESLRLAGCAAVHGVLDEAFLERTREALLRAQAAIRAELGEERLAHAGELGVLRLLMRFDPCFFSLLEVAEVLAVVDATVSDTAILHLQNGLVLPPVESGRADVFQTRFHPDFPRYLNGYVASINTFFAIDEFTEENGATLVVPRTHQLEVTPAAYYLAQTAVPVVCPAGSMLVFDSTLWHAAGQNNSRRHRMAINQQFTRSWIKQQVDYVRALGDEVVLAQRPRTQQLLGWYTRVVTSLDEYYRPTEQRLYRAGQG